MHFAALGAAALACAAAFAALPAAALTIQPLEADSKDAYVTNAPGLADTNFGDGAMLISNHAPDVAGVERGGLIRFELGYIPAGTEITGAIFEAYHSANIVPGLVLAAHLVLADWDEATVTWNSRPAFDPAPFATLTLGSDAGVWRAFEILPQVLDWVNGAAPNYGIYISATPATDPGHALFLRSATASGPDAPRLLLDVDPQLIPEIPGGGGGAAVPVPAPLALLAGALALTAGLRRRG